MIVATPLERLTGFDGVARSNVLNAEGMASQRGKFHAQGSFLVCVILLHLCRNNYGRSRHSGFTFGLREPRLSCGGVR